MYDNRERLWVSHNAWDISNSNHKILDTSLKHVADISPRNWFFNWMKQEHNEWKMTLGPKVVISKNQAWTRISIESESEAKIRIKVKPKSATILNVAEFMTD